MRKAKAPTSRTAARRRGAEMMAEVYGAKVDVDQLARSAVPYHEVTFEHLMGDIWTRSALSVRDRRLLTIGVIAAVGHAGLAEIQFGCAMENGELTPEQVREVVLHLTHYVGWPRGEILLAPSEAAIAAFASADPPSASAAGRPRPSPSRRPGRSAPDRR